MTRAKKNLFVMVLAVMLVAVLTMTALVACGEETPETVKVTFKDGETVVASVDVAKGTTLELSKIPAAPVKDGYTFVGWYVGETKFDGTITFDADTVFTAKYEAIVTPAPETVSVTFKDGDADYKKVTVVKGEKIAAADLPTDPTAALGYRFDGWFNGEAEFDEETAFSADATYTAKYTKVSYVVKFVNGEEETVKLIDIAEDAKLTEENIPANPTKEDFVFMGWYSGLNKAAADAAVTADVTYEAVFSNEASYNGYWVNTTEGEEAMVYVDVENGQFTYKMKSLTEKAYTYDATNGTVTYKEGSFGDSRKSYTFTVIEDKLEMVYTYSVNLEPKTETVVFDRKVGTGLGGVYAMAQKSNVLTVEDCGAISKIGTSDLPYGIFYTTVEDGVTVYHFDIKLTASGALKKLTAVVDEKGNYIMSAEDEANASYEGIYAKDAEVSDITCDGNYLVIFVKGEVTEYTYIVKNVGSYYATVTGTVALNSEITISYGDGLEAIYAITKMPTSTLEGNMAPPSSERGTYTGTEGSVYVDGFGKAVLTPAEGDAINYTYYINKAGNAVLTDADGDVIGVSFDADARTYTVLTADGKAGKYNQDGSSYYSLIIDGYGGAILVYQTSYSTTRYSGTYTYSADGKTVTLASTYYGYNQAYTVEENGKALISADGNKIFLAPGFTAEDKSEQFIGYFVDADGNAIEITSEESSGMWIRFNGADYRLSKNWNGTKLTFEAKDFDAAENYTSYKRTYTVTMVDGKVVIAHDCVQSYDDIYEELVTEAKSVTYTKTTKPFSFAESARGTWYLSDNTVVVITESTITVGGVAGTDYNKSESMGGYNWYFKINGTEYTIYEDSTTAGKWYYGLASSYDAEELSATEHENTDPEQLDAFAGTWTRTDNNYYEYSFTFDGKGTLKITSGKYPEGSSSAAYYNGSKAYTIEGNVATVSDLLGYDWTFTLSTDGKTITVVNFDSDSMTDFNGEITKVGASEPALTEIPEAFIGTWVGTDDDDTEYKFVITATSIEFLLDGSAYGTYAISDLTITAEKITFSDNYTLNVTTAGLNYKDPMGGRYVDVDLTKEAEEAANAFVGTWSGKIGTASWTLVINADGTFTANGTTYHYVIDSTNANKAESVEADGSDKYFTFTILSNGNLRVERYDDDMYETYTGDLVKA